MRSWTAQTTVAGSPRDVLRLLTEPDAIARWTPVPFEVVELDGDRLVTGGKARVRGCLAGQRVEFDVRVLEAEDGHLALTADGPISLEVDYGLCARSDGSEVRACVSVSGSGLWGRALAAATEALLAAGAIQSSMSRLARELEPALAPAP
jgi:uncharacterized protein YndB with AHSA1/START domain